MKKSPVIIVGMHRSGTSMLTRLLEELGLFVGDQKQEDHESLYFIGSNLWILKIVNASWDNPYDFSFLDEEVKKKMIDVIEKRFSLPSRKMYLGKDKVKRYKSIRDLDIPWGWKDPRNTFTLDIWKEMFPEAKIVHIYRNPIDVAQSLRKREIKYRKMFYGKTGVLHSIKQYLKIMMLKESIVKTSSVRVYNIHEGIKLWESYITKALKLEEECTQEIIHVKYEDFLENPLSELERIVRFIGLEASREEIAGVIPKIQSERKYAFVNDDELLELYRSIKERDLVQQLGYHDIA